MCTSRAFPPPPESANPHATSKKQFALLRRVQSQSTTVWQPLRLSRHHFANSPRDKSHFGACHGENPINDGPPWVTMPGPYGEKQRASLLVVQAGVSPLLTNAFPWVGEESLAAPRGCPRPAPAPSELIMGCRAKIPPTIPQVPQALL